MKSVFFTKPKSMTLDMFDYLLEQKEDVLAVVFSGKEAYRNNVFSKKALDNNIAIIDYSECDFFFHKHQDEIEMIWCNTFPKLIKQHWIDSASIAAVNFHAAPLPEYRGVFGFNFAFLNEEKEFGVTAHLLDGDFDTGKIIEVMRFPFDCKRETVKTLVKKAEDQMLQLFKKTYNRYASGDTVQTYDQDLTTGKYYSRQMFEESKQILASDDEADIARKVRAFWFPPYEGAYVEANGRKYPVVTKEILDELG